jgi:hypothetical protein
MSTVTSTLPSRQAFGVQEIAILTHRPARFIPSTSMPVGKKLH